jgi:hypothetical protein
VNYIHLKKGGQREKISKYQVIWIGVFIDGDLGFCGNRNARGQETAQMGVEGWNPE